VLRIALAAARRLVLFAWRKVPDPVPVLAGALIGPISDPVIQTERVLR